VFAVALLLLLTKREYPRLSDSGAGRAITADLNDRFLGIFPRNRLCRGVLMLPESHDRYLRGRRRQALRTNLRKAEAANLRCETMVDSAGVPAALAEVLQDRGNDPLTAPRIAELVGSWSRLLAGPETTLMLAWDARGRPCAFMAALIDESVCLVRLAFANSHEARWALHDHLVATLIARRVRYLLADGHGPLGALGYDTDLQYYQRLLGYELRHLIPRRGGT
jgi:hypothetical protein